MSTCVRREREGEGRDEGKESEGRERGKGNPFVFLNYFIE